MKGARVKWQIRIVEAEQAAVTAEIDELCTRAGTAGALSFGLRQVQLLEADASPQAALRRLLYILATLDLHQRAGGLQPSQVNDALVLARSLLTAAGVTAGSSRLSFLHAELHRLVSLLMRRRGQHVFAAWEQLSAVQDARHAAESLHGGHLVAMGERALRLGHTGLALAYFRDAATTDLPEAARDLAWLGQMRALRLAGDFQGTSMTHKLYLSKHRPNARTKLALVWEEACLDVVLHGSPERLLKCVKRSGTHRENRYLLEASLWVKLLPQREWLGRTLLVRSLNRRRREPTKAKGRFYQIALALEQCYDQTIPLPLRQATLGKALAGLSHVTSVDHELLAWAAAARFLARSNLFDFAALAMLEYTALSRRLSGGERADVLGLMGDITERAWFVPVNL